MRHILLDRKQIVGVSVGLALSVMCSVAVARDLQPVPMRKHVSPPVMQLIVKPKQQQLAQAKSLDVQSLVPFSRAAGVELKHVRSMSGQAQILRLPKGTSAVAAQSYADKLVKSGLVEYAEADGWMFPNAVPNDQLYPKQWDLQENSNGLPYGYNNYGMNLSPAWDETKGRRSVVVAVIDTGLLPHQDIDSNITDTTGRVKPGYDFITEPYIGNDGDGRDADPTDAGDWVEADDPYCAEDLNDDGKTDLIPSSWHGTHVAGTIGAQTNNGIGVTGVAGNIGIQPVRVLGRCGGFNSDIVDGMRWAAGLHVDGVPDNPTPAKVLNLSLGGFGACSTTYQQAITDIKAKGAVVVVAAGNEEMNAASATPANCNGVITVAASDWQGQRAYYSNYGKKVEITAPGGTHYRTTRGNIIRTWGILSTLDSGVRTSAGDNVYRFYQGTSMAAPHVAGLVGLMFSKNPALKPASIVSILQSTADPFPAYDDTAYTGASEYNCTTDLCGAGISNAAAALAAVPARVNTKNDADE